MAKQKNWLSDSSALIGILVVVVPVLIGLFRLWDVPENMKALDAKVNAIKTATNADIDGVEENAHDTELDVAEVRTKLTGMERAMDRQADEMGRMADMIHTLTTGITVDYQKAKKKKKGH